MLINVKPVAPAGPAVLVVTSALARDAGTQEVVVTVTVANTGGTSAANVVVTGVGVGATQATVLPQSLGTIAAGGSASAVVRLPSSVGGPGTRVVLCITGTYTGGTLGSNARTALP